jgi:hypothetical protein
MSRFDPSAAGALADWVFRIVFQRAGFTQSAAGHCRHLAGNLRAKKCGGIDLPA